MKHYIFPEQNVQRANQYISNAYDIKIGVPYFDNDGFINVEAFSEIAIEEIETYQQGGVHLYPQEGKNKIYFICYNTYCTEGLTTLYQFWLDGDYQESKDTLQQGLEKYPLSKYEWILLEDMDEKDD